MHSSNHRPYARFRRQPSLSRRHGLRKSRRSFLMEQLESRQLLANVVVSELLASNDRVLLDYDDDSSDWIELQNDDSTAVDLNGWYLTDNAADLTKWRIPQPTLLNPQDRVVIFASGKDTVTPNGELHSNFQLNSAGEYLALVEPDGTIAWEVSPEFPAQFTDISYGVAQLVDTTELVGPNSTGTVLVPTGDSLGDTWIDAEFDDAGWQAATNGVGYAIQGPQSLTNGFGTRMIDVNGGADGQLNTTTETRNIFNGNYNPSSYQITLDFTSPTASPTVNFAGGGGTFGNDLPYPNGATGTALEDFAVRAQARVHIPPGNWTIGFGSDDGGFLRLEDVTFVNAYNTNGDPRVNDNEIMYEAPRGHGWTTGTFTVNDPSGLTTNLDSLFYERGGGDSFEIAIRSGQTSATPDSNNWALLSNGALGWTVESIAIPPIPVYEDLISTNLADQMYDQQPAATSAYLRMPFDVADSSIYEIMTLRMQYDDAFVAYLNGVEVARGNVSGDPAWDAAANSDRDDADALTSQVFNLSGDLNLLRNGTNVLAIHGLNAGGDETGFFLLPHLEVQDILSTQLSFMAEPTPGASNTTGSVAVLGEPTFSRGGGSFTSSFNLTLTADSPEALIRYTTDGSLPTDSSIPYTAPIPITGTTQIRARAYRADYVASEIVSETYVKLAADVSGFNSDLPVMVIDTFNSGVDALGYMALFEPDAADGRTRLTNDPTKDSRAGIKVRGSSSAGAAKQNFALELLRDAEDDDRNVSLLGMPSESDWVLHAPDWFDRSLINNALAFDLSNQTGNYATRTRFVELFLNTGGGDLNNADYAGVYVLMEKIKRDVNRVDIEKLSSNYTTEPEITGGYIFKFDRADPGDSGFSFSATNGQSLNLKYVEPKEEEMELPQRQAQEDYVRQYMTDLFNAIEASNFINPATGLSYNEYLDVDSFVDHHILNEVMLNVDALRLSAFLFKPRGEKLQAGPLWDFDRAEESNDGRDDSATRWYMDIESVPRWWDRLFQNIDFRQAWIDRWQELRRNELSIENINATIDRMATELNEASSRNASKWSVYAPRTSSAFFSGKLNGTFQGEIEHKKVWLRNRLNYFDGLFVRPPTLSNEGGVAPSSFDLTLSRPQSAARIYYTLDGSDPRLAGGGLAPQAILYSGPISIRENTVVTARSYLSNWNAAISDFSPGAEPWSGPTVGAYSLSSPPTLAITEIHYNPTGPTAQELSTNSSLTNDDFEYIELTNTGNKAFNLVGTQFTNGVQFTFPSMTINAGERVLVVKNRAGFEARYGQGRRIAGEYSGSLNNGGESIQLLDAIGATIHDFSFADNGAWPSRADGLGSSLEVIDTQASYNNPSNWRDASEYLGTPGEAGAGYGIDIVINEVLSHTDLPSSDSIELYNRSGQTINLGGWYLSDSPSDFLKYKIPEDVVIPAGGYVVFDESDFNRGLGVDPNDFALSSSQGDQVVLTQVGADDEIIRWADQVEFGAQANGESWARTPNGVGILYPAASLTLGAVNGEPRIGPVIISEIMYNPPDPGNGVDPDDLEFVELYNTSNTGVVLTEWRIRGGIDFDFEADSTLGPGQFLVVTSFDPQDVANAARTEAFRAHYGLDANVVLVGGYSGKLDNDGERVRLQRPDEPPVEDPELIPRLTEDETKYDDDGGWPTSADAGGFSLTRLTPASLGYDGASWVGAPATPGSMIDHPIVASVEINAGIGDPPDTSFQAQPSSWARQRSEIISLAIAFSEEVSISLDDVSLTNLGVNAPVDADVSVDLAPSQFAHQRNVVTISFDRGTLANGAYELQIAATVVDLDGNPLDGDQDGVGGEAYVFSANPQNRFYLMIGDFNGDGGTTIFDFSTFAYWFGLAAPAAPGYVDLNRDGGVTIFDFPLFADNFGKGVTYPDALSQAFAQPGLPAALPLQQEASANAPAENERLLDDQLAVAEPALALEVVAHRSPHAAMQEERRGHEAAEDLESVLADIASDVAQIWRA